MQTDQEITIHVETSYIEAQSAPDEDQYAFSYTITIHNTGTEAAKLLNRHWVITDAAGRVQEVRGDGVIGDGGAARWQARHRPRGLRPQGLLPRRRDGKAHLALHHGRRGRRDDLAGVEVADLDLGGLCRGVDAGDEGHLRRLDPASPPAHLPR